MLVPTGSLRERLRPWLPVLVWASVIFVFSATPNLKVIPGSDLDLVVRKAGHMTVFGVLATLLWQALTRSAVGRPMALSWLLALGYAVSDEFHQSFTAGRHMAALDVAIDSIGAFLALAVLALWLRNRRSRGAA
jgi:VanZ family protein